ncbi:nicotinamide-nucleotide amidase [Porticoccus sp. W117]|uniref:nicotinamide-nucleotide amidase n=1 Tax=Porticoccus sp. W117 TaxID=3054777 RepID=UPI00259783B1|nr:nicotinamide-nucleotide amidase [Porticoccus sp. W117]MDM3870300.1 nicotinamide-nucleotide amidase [Porticoccus sp. W117]
MSDSSNSLAQQLGDVLMRRGWQVTCAESCTGGGVAEAITSVPGSSRWFEAGFVTYSNAVKQQLLGVSGDTLASHGAVSEAVVREMAQGAQAFANADLAVAISGVAGPDGGSEGKPIGTVWFAWQLGDASCASEMCHFSGDRQSVRQQAVVHALNGILMIANSSS